MNLENLNVQELNTEDQKNVDGGFLGLILLAGMLLLPVAAYALED